MGPPQRLRRLAGGIAHLQVGHALGKGLVPLRPLGVERYYTLNEWTNGPDEWTDEWTNGPNG